MGLISFIKTAGEKIFGKSEEKKEEEKAALIVEHLKKFGFNTNDIQVKVDGDKVTLMGSIDTMENKNKIIVAAGNVEGVSGVEDWIVVKQPPVVAPPQPEKQFYTVKKGDYLSKIAKEVYGNANKYNVIFEANKPMLKDPNLIYPGQVLVIPPLPE
jgi:nucleoid-associated protein YgaU